MKEKEKTGTARSVVISLQSFAARLGRGKPRCLGWSAEAERRLLKQPRSAEVKVPQYLGWERGQKREGNRVRRVPPYCTDAWQTARVALPLNEHHSL